MSSSPQPSSPVRTALCLVLAGVCAALHIWKLAPALPSLQAELGLSLVASGFLLSTVQFAGMTLGLIISLMAERIGLRRCILTGLAVMTVASLVGMNLSTAPLMLLFRAIEGCGVLMVVLPVPSLLRRLLPPTVLSRVMGLWSSHIPIGTILILIIGAWVISKSDWRLLWMLLAGLTAAMMWLVWAIVPADRPVCAASVPATAAKASAWQAVRQTLGSGRVWLVALIFCTYSGQWTAVVGFLPTIYAAAGVAGPLAGLLTGLVAGANIGGNLLAGQLLHRQVAPVRLIMSGFIAMIVSAVIAFGIPAPAALKFIAVLLFSGISGLIPATLFMQAISVAPSPQTTTTTVGWMQQCSALGQFCGPPMVAWVVNLAGGWQWTWLATGTLALGGMVLALILNRQLTHAVSAGSANRSATP